MVVKEKLHFIDCFPDVLFDIHFENFFHKIKDKKLGLKVKKQVKRVICDPEIGKPMKNVRKGTREVYISPFRLSYLFIEKENKLIFLRIYHKDKQ
jgi:mRNA-degrading endonuclease RelE of RelBE toxin-antitoxin system